LGLAAVAGIVRAHRGSLKVSSRLGAGSTFRLLFPASGRTEEVLPQPQPAAHTYQDRGAILVVDDEPGVRNLARLILEKSGFTVIVAGDGGEAVEVFNRHADSIAAAIIDLTMPVMSGDETIAKLRRVRPDVPMVLSSGYGEQEMASRFAGRGVAGFLKKPYEPSELLAILEGAIARRVVQ
jgi:CheY-like chemotaxis protein